MGPSTGILKSQPCRFFLQHDALSEGPVPPLRKALVYVPETEPERFSTCGPFGRGPHREWGRGGSYMNTEHWDPHLVPRGLAAELDVSSTLPPPQKLGSNHSSSENGPAQEKGLQTLTFKVFAMKWPKESPSTQGCWPTSLIHQHKTPSQTTVGNPSLPDV